MADVTVDRYWVQFIQSSSSWSGRPRSYYEAFRFGLGATAGATPAEAGQLDGHDHPVCVIETTEVKIVPFDEMVDERFADDGGEGDRTLTSWRRMYGKVIVSECDRIKREPTPNVPLVCERFRLVYRAPLEEAPHIT
jgi:hypothetical protein